MDASFEPGESLHRDNGVLGYQDYIQRSIAACHGEVALPVEALRGPRVVGVVCSSQALPAIEMREDVHVIVDPRLRGYSRELYYDESSLAARVAMIVP